MADMTPETDTAKEPGAAGVPPIPAQSAAPRPGDTPAAALSFPSSSVPAATQPASAASGTANSIGTPVLRVARAQGTAPGAGAPKPKGKPKGMPPIPQIKIEDPAWWRMGGVPFLVLALAAAAADLSMPRDGCLGLGAGIGAACLLASVVMLRKDLLAGERIFMLALAAVSFLALACSGSVLNYVTALFLPLILFLCPVPQNPSAPDVRYRNWWSFWVARRPKGSSGGIVSGIRGCFPLFICLLAGAACFILFLTIFASGNPVVERIWNTIVDAWNDLVKYLNISWDFALHALYWAIGIILFGLYTVRRPRAICKAPAPAPVAEPGRTLLPFLPFFVLLGINLAFGIATYTDIAYLWFGLVPEGVSQTQYLHEGAVSITWASALAALVLVFFFRRKGSVRHSVFPKMLGYALALQTFLLAVSVYMRLYWQISDYGFTVKRLCAAEAMLLGLVGLVTLVCYMACSGSFRKWARRCLGSVMLLLLAFCICSPARLAGSLNLRYIGSHPKWKFTPSDFAHGKFVVGENLAFAEYVYNTHCQDKGNDGRDSRMIDSSYDSCSFFGESVRQAASRVALRAQSATWLTWTLGLQQDVPAAERILGRPIKLHLVEEEEPGDTTAAPATDF